MTEHEKILLRGLDYRYTSAGLTKKKTPLKNRKNVCFLINLEQMDMVMKLPAVQKLLKEANS